MKHKKSLVTGGAGFVGSHVVDALVKKGHRVVIIDNLSTGKKENIHPRAKFYKLDIRSPKVEGIFKKEKPDYVFHLAAQTDVRKSVADPLYDAEINIMGSLNLIQNSYKYKIKKFIFTSSGGVVYGNTKILPTPETASTNPISPYGVSKLAAEKYLFYAQKEFGLPYVCFRPPNIYGPRQRPDGEAGVVAIFINKILKGGQPIINGDGKNTRDYVYVEDIARANILALSPKARGAYNIGTGKETTVNEIFEKIVGAIGRPVKKIYGPRKPGEQRRSAVSARKIKRELGWEPKVGLDKGIEKTVAWMKIERGFPRSP